MSNAANEFIELRQQRDFSAVISTGFQFIRQNWKPLYRPLFLICLPVYLVASVFIGSFFRTMFTSARNGNVAGMMTGMGSMLIGYVLMGISMLLLYTMVYEYMRFYMLNQGLAPTTGQLWKQAIRQLPSYFVILLLAGLFASFGVILLFVGFIWLGIVFSMAMPLRAFDRAEIGDCVLRSFKVIKGRWWKTFWLVIALSGLIVIISYIIYLPFMLLTSFGAMSGLGEMKDPGAIGERMGWIMTLVMALIGVMTVLVQPFLHVPLAFQALSLIEEKEGRGLLERVDEMIMAPTAS